MRFVIIFIIAIISALFVNNFSHFDYFQNLQQIYRIQKEESLKKNEKEKKDLEEVRIKEKIEKIQQTVQTEQLEELEKPEQTGLLRYLKPKPIDVRVVALVRCTFISQYFKISTQPWNEMRINLGSGVVVSPDGYILTAAHILKPDYSMLNDPAGREWEREKCDVVITDDEQTPVQAVSFWGQDDDPRFIDAEIFFEPDDEIYRNGDGLDFAVLKINPDKVLHFLTPVPEFIDITQGSEIIALGYPGKESVHPQSLERFDGEYYQTIYFPQSSCDGTLRPCGLRYEIRRSIVKHQKDFWKKTDLGIISPYARSGFSGAPAFLNGNLIGIITHGISGEDSGDNWDRMFVLTSFDICAIIPSICGKTG